MAGSCCGQPCVRRLKQARDPVLQAMCRAVLPRSSTRVASHPALSNRSTIIVCSVITAKCKAVWNKREILVWYIRHNGPIRSTFIDVFQGLYLSLVVLYVEEGFAIGQINDLQCSILGLVYDTKMQIPLKTKERKLVRNSHVVSCNSNTFTVTLVCRNFLPSRDMRNPASGTRPGTFRVHAAPPTLTQGQRTVRTENSSSVYIKPLWL